jgi:uncharacterized membrane protein YbhN (UPF0104 family)
MLSPTFKKILNAVIGIILFVWVSYIIYGQLHNNTNLKSACYNMLLQHWTLRRLVLFVIVLLLMLVNWSIEALKWQLLIKHLQAISFLRSLRSIFTGISVSLLTPNRVGEYGGRIIYLNDGVKGSAITANIVGSFAQFIAAAIFGIVGCGYYLSYGQVWFMPWLLACSVLGVVVLTLLYFQLSLFTKWLVHFSFFKKLENHISIVQTFNKATLLKLIAISALRYIVFALQYYILLRVFYIDISFANAMPTIFLIFWCMAILPSITLAEAPIRSEMSIYFLGAFSANALGIMSASILLWLINLILPALLGALLSLGVKLFKERG